MTRKILALFAAVFLTLGFAACQVEQTEEGEMPEVDVEGGELPEYDVDAPDVEVGTETKEIEVPTVDVEPPEEDEEEPPQ